MTASILPLHPTDEDTLREALACRDALERELATADRVIAELAPLVWAAKHPNQRRFVKMQMPEIRAMVR